MLDVYLNIIKLNYFYCEHVQVRIPVGKFNVIEWLAPNILYLQIHILNFITLLCYYHYFYCQILLLINMALSSLR